MSLMIIAMTGILLGFLCVMVGFFMEGAEGQDVVVHPAAKEKKSRAVRKRTVGHKKAA